MATRPIKVVMPASAWASGNYYTSNFTNIKKEMRIDHIALFSCNLETMRQFFLDHFEAESNEAVDAKTIELRGRLLGNERPTHHWRWLLRELHSWARRNTD
jgi:hypothetical protein